MQGNNIVKEAMTLSDVTQKDLQKLLNLKSQSSISTMLKSDMRISTFVKLLNVLNCELVVQHKSDDKTWEVTNE